MKQNTFDLKLGYFLLIFMVFVGLIVKAHIHILEPVFYTIFVGEHFIDIFSYYKAIFLIIVVASALLVLVYGLIKYPDQLKRFNHVEFYLLLGMMLLAGLSTLYTQYPLVGVFGSVERYEGLLVWLAYLMMPFLFVYFIRDEEKLYRYIQWLVFATGLIFVIGAFQFFGLDLFKVDWMKYVLFTEQQREMTTGVSVNAFGVYTTLYNQNYVGTVVVLMLPLMAYCLGRQIKAKRNFKNFLIPAIALGSALISLVGAYSLGGYIGIVITSIVFTSVFMFFQSKIKWIVLVITIAGLVIIPVILLKSEMVSTQLNDVEGLFKKKTEEPRLINDIIYGENSIQIDSKYGIIMIEDQQHNIVFYGADGKELIMTATSESNVFQVTEDGYESFQFGLYLDQNIVEVRIEGYKIPVLLTEDGLYLYGKHGLPVRTYRAEWIGFEGYESFATNRGYIWSRSIPLLKTTSFIGQGADTFAFNFPQYDVERLNYTDSFGRLIDKPHSLYLQEAISFGGLFLVFQIILLVVVLARLFVVAVKGNDYLALCLLSAITSYVAIALVNDSNVSTSPYMWMLIAIAMVHIQNVIRLQKDAGVKNG